MKTPRKTGAAMEATANAPVESAPPADALAGLRLNREQPLLDQIVGHLTAAIRRGDLPAGARLPSIRATATRLGVNRNTVAGAFRELAEKGYVETRFGGGSIVRPVAAFLSSESGASEGSASEGDAQQYGQAAAFAPSPALTASEWEGRFAGHLDTLLSRDILSHISPTAAQESAGPGGSHKAARGEPVNLFQQRPYTALFPVERFQQCLNTVLRRSGRHLLNYGSPAGYLPLREQIVRRLRASGIAADAGRVMVISGSQQGIDLLARAFLNRGEAVVVESPMYSIALKIFSMNGARLLPYRLLPDGVAINDLDALNEPTPPKLFYAVPNFHNPTTHSYTLAERKALLARAARMGSLLVEDASDQELHRDPSRWPSLAALEAFSLKEGKSGKSSQNTGDDPQNGAGSDGPGMGRVIHLNTFSKALVPALRMGYLCAPAPVVHRLTELKEMTDLSHSLILQAAIAEFMERGWFDDHLNRVRAFYLQRMETVLDMLDKALPRETPFTRPDGGLCVWVDLPAHMDTRRLYDQLARKGVLVSPGELYHPGPARRNGLRLCVVNEDEARLAAGFRVLGDELKQALRHPHPAPGHREYQPIH